MFYAQLATASEHAGLQINESKCELWGKCILIPDGFPLDKIPVAEWSKDVVLLGSPIGSDAFALRYADKALSSLSKALAKWKLLNDSRTRYFILRYCLSACRITHLLRTCSYKVCCHIASTSHDLIMSGVSDLIGLALDDRASLLSSLPLRLGGLGIHDPWHVLFPAAISSRLQAAQLNAIDLPYSGVFVNWEAWTI